MKKTINGLSVFLSNDHKSESIIFVHGFPYDHNMWQDQVDDLSKNYLCVSYDIRGLGDSPAGDGQFTMESFVDDCDTKSTADDDEGKLKRAAAIKQINSGKFYEFIDSFILNCFGERFVKEKSAQFRKIVDRSKKSNPIGVKGCLLAMAGRTDTTESLSKIDIPVLIICGSEDKLSPPDVMKSIADKIPNANFLLVEGAGHMTPIENPQAVNSAIRDFLFENDL